MTSYKIENFFSHLDHAQTREAVAHGAGRLCIAARAEAITEDMTAAQLALLVKVLVVFMAELDPGEAA